MIAHSIRITASLAVVALAHAGYTPVASAQEDPAAPAVPAPAPAPTASAAREGEPPAPAPANPVPGSLAQGGAPRAEAATAPIAPTGSAVAAVLPKPEKGRIGAQLDLMPMGTLHVGVGRDDESYSTATAVGLGGFVEWAISPTVSIGLSPRLVLGVSVKGKDGDGSAKTVDARARLRVHGPLSDKVEGYGLVAPGYSWMFLPDDDLRPTGFVLAFGGGLAIDVAPEAKLVAELSYQLGYQGGSIDGRSYDFDVDYLSLSFGVSKSF